MKHPSLHDLQDYFEGESTPKLESKIHQHLDECDRCSLILSEMAKVDILFSKHKKIEVTKKTKEAIFNEAFNLLDKKKEKIEFKSSLKEKRKDKVRDFSKKIEELLEFGFRELSNPIVHAASLALILGVVTEVARTETETKDINIIENHISVVYSELQGDNNEMD